MTTIYFIRHAEPNYQNHNDCLRELTIKGMEDSKLVTAFLSDKQIDLVFSSPYRRSVDTIKDFADTNGLSIHLVDDFRERKVNSSWLDDFESFCKSQWKDFNFKLPGGESLQDVEDRNIRSLIKILQENSGKNIVIGTHGTSLSTIIHYFNSSFGYEDFQKIRNIMPWIIKFNFIEDKLIDFQNYHLSQNSWKKFHI